MSSADFCSMRIAKLFANSKFIKSVKSSIGTENKEKTSSASALRDKKTHNVIQNLQVVFAIASNREGKPVCECPTHADLERTPNENDEHSPDRSRPYRSKIWSSSGKMRSLPPEETEISVSLKWAVAGPGCLPPKNVHTGHPR